VVDHGLGPQEAELADSYKPFEVEDRLVAAIVHYLVTS